MNAASCIIPVIPNAAPYPRADLFHFPPGARVYYLRNILHDWSDTECIRILRPIHLAMDPTYSKLLIDQWVVPAQGATSFMTHQDFNMMAVYAGMERTEEQWRGLLRQAGFQIEHIWKPEDEVSESIIEAVVSN